MGNFTCRIWREVLLLLAVVYLFTSGFGSQQGSSFPPIEQMGEGIFKFGEVILDQKKRTISLPAVCNQTSGLVEYGLVHVNGKIHESLFRTNVSPRLIHASLLLLKERSFPEFFGDQNYSSSPRFFDIFVEWEWNNSSIVRPLSSMIYNESSSRFLSEGRFLFTGSKKGCQNKKGSLTELRNCQAFGLDPRPGSISGPDAKRPRGVKCSS